MHLGVSDPRAQAGRPDEAAELAPVDVAVAIRPALVREVLSRALGTHPGMRVVAFDTDAEDCSTDRIRELHPRILIIDDDDSVSGQEALIRRLHRASPSTRIIVLTTRSDESVLRRFARAGAFAMVQNGSDLDALVRAIEAACAGVPCDSRSGDPKCLPVPGRRPVAPDADRRLTNREWEVAELVAKGFRNKAIALRLNISVVTVKSHLNNSFRKLELDGRLALGILARSRLGPRTEM
jgi:DNA-binding NarL/FixJ family response regulator